MNKGLGRPKCSTWNIFILLSLTRCLLFNYQQDFENKYWLGRGVDQGAENREDRLTFVISQIRKSGHGNQTLGIVFVLQKLQRE